MDECKPVATPADMNVKLLKDDGVSNEVDRTVYQAMVGSLLYAAIATRPDISYAVGAVSKFCAAPSTSHLTAVKRILRYLKGTAELALTFMSGNSSAPVGYADANWAGDLDDRHSTTGNVFLMAGGAISWLSKKQTSVALSTAEAEYISLSSASQENAWLRRLLVDIGLNVQGPTVLMEDNQGAISMAQNPVNHSRTKHIDIRYHYVRECVQDGSLILQYCPSEKMLADILTKPLPKFQFEMLRSEFGLL